LECVVRLNPTLATAYVHLGLIAMQQLKNYRRYDSVLCACDCYYFHFISVRLGSTAEALMDGL